MVKKIKITKKKLPRKKPVKKPVKNVGDISVTVLVIFLKFLF